MLSYISTYFATVRHYGNCYTLIRHSGIRHSVNDSTEQIWRVDKINIFLTLDCHISAIEDLSHKSLESRARASVHFCTN